MMSPARQGIGNHALVPAHRSVSGTHRLHVQKHRARAVCRSNPPENRRVSLPPLFQGEDTGELVQISLDGDPDALYAHGMERLQGGADLPTAFICIKHAAKMKHRLALLEYGNMLEHGIGCPVNREAAYKVYKKAANDGDPVAAYRCGCLLKDCGRKTEEVFSLFRTACDANVPGALLELALCYRNGVGVDVNLRESAKLFKLLTDQEDPKGTLEYALAFKNGWGVEANKDTFRELLDKALALNCTEAKVVYAHCLETGDVYPQDIAKAEQIYRDVIREGSISALFRLGNLLQNQSRYEEAMECFEQAAEQHHQIALFSLAMLQLKFPRLKKVGMANLKKAADQDNPRAQYNYALHLEKENGDPAEIARYYKMASDAGLPNAMCNYASILLKSDPDTALHLFQTAADKGHAISAYRYAKIVQESEPESALRYFRMAAEKMHARSQYELALFLIDTSPQEALVLLQMSANSGYSKAQQKYKEILENSGENGLSSLVTRDVDFSSADSVYAAAQQILEPNAAKCYFEQHMKPNDDLFKLRYAQVLVRSDPTAGLKIITDMAKTGNMEAKYVYARMLEKGKVVPQNLLEAKRIYQEGIKLNHPHSMYRFSRLMKNTDYDFSLELAKRISDMGIAIGHYQYARLLEGVGQEEKALELYKKASEQGLDKAQYRYARAHEVCVRGVENYEVATKYYALAAQQGHAKAMNNYGRILERGLSGVVDVQRAAELYQQSSERGNVIGRYNYARLLEAGIGTKQNAREAARLYRELSDEANLGVAQYRYARMCHNGIGVDKNFDEASKYYRLAIRNNVEEAKQNYGVLLSAHNKWDEAARYIEMAAQSQYSQPSAKYNYAQILMLGVGVAQDQEKAERLLKSAAASFVPAMVGYAQLLDAKEEKTEEILEEIFDLYQKAADAEDEQHCFKTLIANAQYQVGIRYRDGTGIERDENLSKQYLELAADNGHAEAQSLIRGPPKWDLKSLCL